MMYVHMGLSDVEFNHLRMIFISEKVWDIMWNQISWRGIQQIAFRTEVEVGGMKEYLTKVALYSAAQQYSYEQLQKDIFIGGKRGEGGQDGIVTAALKLRLERMKLVYQMKQGKDLLTKQELSYCADKIWDYVAVDLQTIPLFN